MTAAAEPRYRVLATDYDGTLASQGRVPPETCDALEALRASGRNAVLVTGRILDDLRGVFHHLELFDWVVAENGPVLYSPQTREERLLASPPPDAFVLALRARGVTPLSIGRVVVATIEPHVAEVLAVIQELGLEYQIVFNKGALMVLPPGINKGIGLSAALAELAIGPESVAGVGDAENDHSMLNLCGLSAAVADAVPALAERADVRLTERSTSGVRELIGMLLSGELRDVTGRGGKAPVAIINQQAIAPPESER